MNNLLKISDELKMDYVEWRGYKTLMMSGWRMIKVRITDEVINSNLKKEDIEWIVNIIKEDIEEFKLNCENKQWSILPNNILAVR